MHKRLTFTVFTPTYNRAHTLPRVYESLVAQTFTDFEWLVVDDGSTDNTAELLASWQREAPFPMRVHCQENLGKPTATNRAAALARGELLVTLDSDDTCLPQALERLNAHWQSIPEKERERFCAVTCPYQSPQGEVIGGPYPKDVQDGWALDLFYGQGLLSERWGCRRTDLVRRFAYPEIPGLLYIPEGLAWDRMDRLHLNRFINEPLLVYHHNPAESVSKRLRDLKHNALGYVLYHGERLSKDLAYFPSAPHKFLASAVHYGRFGLHAGQGPLRQCKGLSALGAKALWLACLPVAVLIWLKDRILLRQNA